MNRSLTDCGCTTSEFSRNCIRTATPTVPCQDELLSGKMQSNNVGNQPSIDMNGSDNVSIATASSKGLNCSHSSLTGINLTSNEKNPNAMVPLAEDFKPGENDVICGRGKKCYNHVGNEKFRRNVAFKLDQYKVASSKLDKSFILSTIVTEVRKLSPNGGFVKKDPTSGRWYEVGDFLAREKTSQAFRDALHENYRSSNKSKKKRRQEEQAKAAMSASFLTTSSMKYQRSAVGRTRSAGQDFEYMLRKSNYEFLTRQNQAAKNQAAKKKAAGTVGAAAGTVGAAARSGGVAPLFRDDPVSIYSNVIQNQAHMMRLSEYNSYPNTSAFHDQTTSSCFQTQEHQEHRHQNHLQRHVQPHNSFSGFSTDLGPDQDEQGQNPGTIMEPQQYHRQERGKGQACDLTLSQPQRCPSPDNSIKSAPASGTSFSKGTAGFDPYQRSKDGEEFAPLSLNLIRRQQHQHNRHENECPLPQSSANDMLSRLSTVCQEDIPAEDDDNPFEPIPIFEHSLSSLSGDDDDRMTHE